jgi:hypothetical protein
MSQNKGGKNRWHKFRPSQVYEINAFDHILFIPDIPAFTMDGINSVHSQLNPSKEMLFDYISLNA